MTDTMIDEKMAREMAHDAKRQWTHFNENEIASMLMEAFQAIRQDQMRRDAEKLAADVVGSIHDEEDYFEILNGGSDG